MVNLNVWNVLAEVVKTYDHVDQKWKHDFNDDLVSVIRLAEKHLDEFVSKDLVVVDLTKIVVEFANTS